MRIEYEITTEDMLYFNWYHWRHSPALQAAYRMGFIGAPAVGAVSAIIFHGFRFSGWWLLTFLLSSAVFAGFYEWFVRRQLRRTTTKAFAEGRNRGVLGRHVLELSAEGLKETTDVNSTLHSWKGVERIVADSSHIFIYTQAAMAHVVPRRAFSSISESDAFVLAAKSWHEGGA